MKAAIYDNYGPPEVLGIREVDKPALEEADRVLLKIHSACVNPFDIFFRRGYYPIRLTNGLLKPKTRTSGGDFAGTVESVGAEVDRFKPGDRVFGFCNASHAEYALARQRSLALMPENVSFNEAAAIPTVALTALQALRDVARIQKGQKVLIYGASGGIGHIAVQLAKYYETEVTAVCSTANLVWVEALGADFMIDYTREDFAKNGKKYDLILDTVGKRTFFNSRGSLTESGVYITEHALYPKYHYLQFLIGALTGDRRAKSHLARANEEDMGILAGLLGSGAIKPVIEKIYPLDRISEAHRHVENGRTKGKVVVEIPGAV